jgi:hypothetical protein
LNELELTTAVKHSPPSAEPPSACISKVEPILRSARHLELDLSSLRRLTLDLSPQQETAGTIGLDGLARLQLAPA